MTTDGRTIEFAAVTVITAAGDVLKAFKAHPKIGQVLKDQNKGGGFFCVAESGFGILTSTLMGSCLAEKAGSYRANAERKVEYLLKNPDRVMSREGRDPENGLWGGGLHLPHRNAFMAFSGFPEHIDELYVFGVAAKLHMLRRDHVLNLLAQFPNDYASVADGETLFI